MESPSAKLNAALCLATSEPSGVQELDVNRFFHGQLRGIGHFELHIHVGLGHSSAEVGGNVVVAHVGFRGLA